MIPSLASTPYNTPSSSSSNTASPGGLNPSANEQAFLQLLVAQLKNQDPTQPQDGTQFVAELAQFTSVDEQLAMRQDLDQINSLLAAGAASQAGKGSGASNTGQTNGTSAPTQS